MKASIVLISYNMGYHIRKTIKALLSQSEKDFELIIIDDASTDNTREIVESFLDKRISYTRNAKNLRISLSRNKAIKKAKAKYIFFTDADCVPHRNWLKKGLELFENNNCIGIEGKIYYVSPSYQPTYSDRVVKNTYGGEYMTANMAYKKSILLKIGLFDPAFDRNSDRAVALRAQKYGKIIFSKEMIVYHGFSKWKPTTYMKSAQWVQYRTVLFLKYFNEKYDMIFRIYAPTKLLTIFFPPLLLIKLFTDKHKTKEDYVLFLLIYPRLVYERLLLWKTSWREKVFII